MSTTELRATRTSRMKRRLRTAAAVLVVAGSLSGAAACTSASASTSGPASTLRLGYFANLTHATALVGVSKGYFQQALGSTKLSTQIYNAGPAEMTALLGGQLDAAFVGPSSALSAYAQSHGEALRIVAGATTGGAELVVKPDITSPSQLKGKRIASPQKGNTQDVALRYWLKQQGFTANPDGTGDVAVEPQDNATTLDQFKAGHIDGAWLPEPWASRLVVEAGAKVLVDEKDLWPGGRFATTNLVVSTSFLKHHPETVRALISGEIAANAWITANPAAAQQAVNDQLKTLTGKALKTASITRAWSEQAVTDDPIAASLQSSYDHASSVSLIKKTDLHGIYDLSILDSLLTAKGEPSVSDGGLGPK